MERLCHKINNSIFVWYIYMLSRVYTLRICVARGTVRYTLNQKAFHASGLHLGR